MFNQQMKPSYIYILYIKYIMNILELIVFLFDDSETPNTFDISSCLSCFAFLTLKTVF